MAEDVRTCLEHIAKTYQGILQAAVTYLHLQRGNREGALKVYQRASGISGPGCHAAKEPTWKSCWDTWLRCYPPQLLPRP